MQTTATNIECEIEESHNNITRLERLGYMFAITLNLILGLIFTILD